MVVERIDRVSTAAVVAVCKGKATWLQVADSSSEWNTGGVKSPVLRMHSLPSWAAALDAAV